MKIVRKRDFVRRGGGSRVVIIIIIIIITAEGWEDAARAGIHAH